VDNTLLAAQAEAAERKFMAYDMEGYALSRAAANLSLPMGVLVIRSVADINGAQREEGTVEYCSYLSTSFALAITSSELAFLLKAR